MKNINMEQMLWRNTKIICLSCHKSYTYPQRALIKKRRFCDKCYNYAVGKPMAGYNKWLLSRPKIELIKIKRDNKDKRYEKDKILKELYEKKSFVGNYNPLEYNRMWRAANREKINKYYRDRFHRCYTPKQKHTQRGICRNCEKTFEYLTFNKRVRLFCDKKCMNRFYAKRYVKFNREKARKYANEYSNRNREKIRLKSYLDYHSNTQRYKEYAKKYQKENYEDIKKNNKKWYLKNKEYINAINRIKSKNYDNISDLKLDTLKIINELTKKMIRLDLKI